MTYLQFHLYFTIPQTILLWVFLIYKTPKSLWLPIFKGSSLLAFLAVTWTTPWDNYLIYKNIWWYGADKVMGTIGYVPIEEYFFFIIQCYFTGSFLGFFLHKAKFQTTELATERKWGNAIMALAIFLLALGVLCLNFTESLYLGLILSWAAPIWLIQLVFGRDLLAREWKKYLALIMIPSLYLCVGDYIAIASETWSISSVYTLGWNLGPLPIEEITFFFSTNIMLSQGLILFLHPQGQERAATFIKSLRSLRGTTQG